MWRIHTEAEAAIAAVECFRDCSKESNDDGKKD